LLAHLTKFSNNQINGLADFFEQLAVPTPDSDILQQWELYMPNVVSPLLNKLSNNRFNGLADFFDKLAMLTLWI
jgi:cytochrome c553